MFRTAALLVAGATLVGLGAVSLLTSGPSSPTAATSEPPQPAGFSTPTAPAGRARAAHPEQAAFEPSAVAFTDGRRTDVAAVDRVLTGADGALGLPADPRRMGWWAGGSRAGAPYGSVVLAGHLDSRELGVGFSALMSGLEEGERVVLTDADQVLTYVVTRRSLQPRTSVARLTALFSDRGSARLVMITCGGTYDRDAGAYSDNLVVEARPLGPPRALAG